MKSSARFLVVLLITSATAPRCARAQDDTESRLRALEQQLHQALTRLDQQRRATEQAQREIIELRRQMSAAHATRRAAPETPTGTVAEARTPAQPPATLDARIQEQVRKEVARSQEENRQPQAEVEGKIAAMQPAVDDYAQRFLNKFKISTLLYGDWSFYQETGFGPQFITQVNPPGPGNDNYNSFDITRTYVNLLFTPSDDWTFRLTPNIYRASGGSSQKLGKDGGVSTNLDGNLNFRLKYAYVDYNSPFAWAKRRGSVLAPLADTKLTFGQQPNPLIAWEEDLYGYRFTSLVPWNYTSLSSTQTGISSHGPVRFGDRQYLDYDLGIYTNASFHAAEQSETKTGMLRASYYPFGARSRFDGLGITGFMGYGYPNKTPDGGPQSHINRVAALVHYTTDDWGIAGEYDQGHNAFNSGNLFSGSGPADEFGLGKTPHHEFDEMVHALQNNGRAVQQGLDFFGHVKIPRTPFSLFAMYQNFLPNTHASTNPLDFDRIVGGIGYQYSRYLRFALTSENLLYYHSQFNFPLAEARALSKSSVADLKGNIVSAVPDNIQAVFLNVEFNY